MTQNTPPRHDHSGPGVGGSKLSPEQVAVDGRDLISTESRVIDVGTDTETLQDALDLVPWFLYHDYVINIDGYSNKTEDALVHPTVASTVGRSDSEGVVLTITGGSGIGGNADIGSLYFDGVRGGTTQAKGLTLHKATPYTDEGAAFEAKNSRCDAVRVKIGDNIQPTGNGYTSGFVSYASNVELRECDLGQNLVDYGALEKKAGVIHEQVNVPTPTQGTVDEQAYWAAKGWVYFAGNGSTLTGENGLVRNLYGLAYDMERRRLYGVDTDKTDRVNETLAGGEAAYRSEYMYLKGQGGAADTLDTISGGTRGDTVTLNAEQDITVSHGSGNILLDGQTDFTLSFPGDTLSLIYDGNNWLETSRSKNG